MPMPDCSGFAEAVIGAEGRTSAAFEALCALAGDTVGIRLFTVMSYDAGQGVARRIFSNMPDAYPVSGTKPARETEWSRRVIGEKRIFVANDIAGIREVFDDHELIRSLGCESVINVPIVAEGRVCGTVNCLHEAGFYTPERVEAAEALKLPGLVCLLLNEHVQSRGGR